MDKKANINRSIAIGASWMVGLRWADKLIGLISMAILARLLLPEDFGLVAYAIAFYAILEILFSFSFETVLIRDQNATRENYDTAWTLNVVIGLVLGALVYLLSDWMGLWFRKPEVGELLRWMALMPILRGIANIGIVDFQKKMDFNKEFFFNFSVRIVSAIITVFLAWSLRSFWALVYGNIIKDALRVLMSFIMSPYRPRFSLAKFDRVFGFSIWLLFQNILSGINHRLPIFVIGRAFPVEEADAEVAYFNFGFELSHLASQEMAAPIRKALFPGVSIIAEDHQRMINTILLTIGVIVVVGLPMTVGVAVTAPMVVPLLLGPNWAEVVPLIQILAINAITYILYSNSHVVFLALNRPQYTFYLSFVRTMLLLPAVVYTAPKYGAVGAAWCLSIINIFMMLIEYVVVFRMTELRTPQVLSVIWRSALAVIAMAAAVSGLYEYFLIDSGLSLGAQLAACVASGAAVYALILFPLWKIHGKESEAEAYVLGIFKKIFGKILPSKG